VERVIHFLGGPRAVGAARDAVMGHAAGLPTSTLEDLELLVSEVVTNAVRHGRADRTQTIELRLVEEPGLLRVEVSDEGPGFDRHKPKPRGDGGWGLLFVDRLADRWDVEHDADRTTVWFEMDVSERGPRDPERRPGPQRRRRPLPMFLTA
jgi:anti-sigma regulatory factor (Ser/Thr protein kinase)